MSIEDFKLADGQWARYLRYENGTRAATRAYVCYNGMMSRILPGGAQQRDHPSYVGTGTTFKGFQEFTDWCHAQVGYREGYQLDKDLLEKGNKVYCPEKCIFLPSQLNSLLIKRTRDRGGHPLGVCYYRGKFIAQCSNGTGTQRQLGRFSTSDAAFYAYKTSKEAYIKEQANKWRGRIDPRAYEALMSYQVEITD